MNQYIDSCRACYFEGLPESKKISSSPFCFAKIFTLEERMNGMTLKIKRVKADVRAVEIARYIGKTKAYISLLEGRHYVAPEAASEYLSALKAIINQRVEVIGLLSSANQ